MKLLSICLAVALSLVLCVDAIAAEAQYSAPDMVYPIYEYDADSNVLLVSIVYTGQGLLALGLSVDYCTDELEYTGYSRGDGFSAHDTTATLDDRGRINVLTHSGEMLASGEIIRLSFVLKVDLPCSVRFEILPLTSICAVTRTKGEILPCEIEIINIDCSIDGGIPIVESVCVDETGMAALSLSADGMPTLLEITTVSLSGKIERREVFCDKDFSTYVGDSRSGYVAVIIRPYFEIENKKIYAAQSVCLFCDGEYMD